MSNSHNSHPKETDEIDLRDIKIAIASFLEAIGFFVFKAIAFILRKWYFVGIALLISFYLN